HIKLQGTHGDGLIGPVGGEFRKLYGNPKGEGTALPLPGFQKKAAPEKLGQLFGNGESQAIASVLLLGGLPALGKLLKDEFPFFGFYPYAGVVYADSDPGPIFFFRQSGGYRDMALLGELKGIAYQVGQNLYDSKRVAQNGPLQDRVDVKDKFHLFFGTYLPKVHRGLPDEVGKHEWQFFEFHFSGLQFGVVQ